MLCCGTRGGVIILHVDVVVQVVKLDLRSERRCSTDWLVVPAHKLGHRDVLVAFVVEQDAQTLEETMLANNVEQAVHNGRH